MMLSVALPMLVPMLAAFAEGTAVSYSDFSSIITAITGQISVANIVAVIAAVLGITVGICFMWWGARYGVKKIWRALKGKFGV